MPPIRSLTNCKPLSDDELRARELEIIEGPLPGPLSPLLRASLRNGDSKLAAALDRQAARCHGRRPGGKCTADELCGECQAARRYEAFVLHRQKHGKPIHPSDRAGCGTTN